MILNLECNIILHDIKHIVAGSLESAYSLSLGVQEIWGQVKGAFSSFMISRPILYRSDWQKFRFWNGVTGCIQSSLSM